MNPNTTDVTMKEEPTVRHQVDWATVSETNTASATAEVNVSSTSSVEETDPAAADSAAGNTDNDDSDPVVKEVDVYLASSLSENIFILQYPTKAPHRHFDNTRFIGAKLKPKQCKLELEVELDTSSENYSRPKGEQFALNVDGKQQPSAGVFGGGPLKPKEPQRYFRSNLMDKIVYTSSSGALGPMSRLYHLGLLDSEANALHLTPVKSVLQMRPSFDHFDIYEKNVKEYKESQGGDVTDYSTEEEMENDGVDKAELVTLKYASHTTAQQAAQQQQELDQQWIPLAFGNAEQQQCGMQSLRCASMSNALELNYSNDEFIRRLVGGTSASGGGGGGGGGGGSSAESNATNAPTSAGSSAGVNLVGTPKQEPTSAVNKTEQYVTK